MTSSNSLLSQLIQCRITVPLTLGFNPYTNVASTLALVIDHFQFHCGSPCKLWGGPGILRQFCSTDLAPVCSCWVRCLYALLQLVVCWCPYHTVRHYSVLKSPILIETTKCPWDLQLLAHGLVHVHSSIKLWQLWTSHIPYFRQFPWLKNVDGCFSSSPQIGKSYQHLYWWLLYFWYFCCLTWTGVKTAESLTAYVVVTTWVVLWVIPLQSIVSPLQIRRRILGKKRGRLSCWGLQLKLDHPDVFFMHIICTTSFPCLWTLHGVSTLNITVYWFCFIPPSVNSSHN